MGLFQATAAYQGASVPDRPFAGAPMRSSVTALLALLPGTALAGGVDFLAEGASAVDLSGTVEVPIQRGVDTNSYPMVLATGAVKEDPDEFLMEIDLTGGPSRCTEAVVGTLGGWVKEFTVARQGSLFGKTVKTVVKGGYIPELHIGDMTLRDVHCKVDPKANALSIASLPDMAAAYLPSKGVYAFAPSAEADALLSGVGPVIQGQSIAPHTTWLYDTKVANLGHHVLIPATVGGAEQPVAIAHASNSLLGTVYVAPDWSEQRSGQLVTTAKATLGTVELPTESYTVVEGPVAELEAAEGMVQVGALLGRDALYALDVAVHPASGRVSVATAADVQWTDPAGKLLEEAREAYEKQDESAGLLRPVRPDGPQFAQVWGPDETCVLTEIDAPYSGTVEGIRMLGAAARTVTETKVDCVEPQVVRAEEGDVAADDTSGESGDAKEFKRRTNYAEALLAHGQVDQAVKVMKAAAADAGDDCSEHLTVAGTLYMGGDLDGALVHARKAGELYDAWMAIEPQARLDVQNGKVEGKAQSHSCAEAWSGVSEIMLARGSSDKALSIYESHMDLQEDLAQAAAIAHLQQGRPDKAHGALLEALNVGGRGDPTIHVTLGLVGAMRGRDRIAEASLERMTQLWDDWFLDDGLAALAVAREIGGEARAKAFTEHLIETRPFTSVPWVLYGLEAQRRGDAAAVAKVAEMAPIVAERELNVSANRTTEVCEAAALYAVAGDEASYQRLMSMDRTNPVGPRLCNAAEVVHAAVGRDAEGTGKAIETFRKANPSHPLGALGLVEALPSLTE